MPDFLIQRNGITKCDAFGERNIAEFEEIYQSFCVPAAHYPINPTLAVWGIATNKEKACRRHTTIELWPCYEITGHEKEVQDILLDKIYSAVLNAISCGQE